MYGATTASYGAHDRSMSAGSIAQPAPAARTIYNYGSASQYPRYAGSSQQVYLNSAGDDFRSVPSAPCACADCCGPPTSTTQGVSRYYASSFPSTSSYGNLPSSSSTSSFGASTNYATQSSFHEPYSEQPLYRPVPRRPPLLNSYSAPLGSRLPTPPQDQPSFVDCNPYYQNSWSPVPPSGPPTLPLPSSTYPDGSYFEGSPDLGRSSSFHPQLLPPPMTPLSLKASLERRRSSGGSIFEGQTLSRRASTLSLSPYGSEHSFGSEDGGSSEERHETVTPFMSKLSYLLNNPDYSSVIRWNAEGTAFVFAHATQELADCFSRVFRHSNSHSFVRQLNIYDFKRLSSLELHAAVESVPHPHSELTSADFAGFSHPLFFRDTPEHACDLSKIKPKMPRKASNRNLAASSALVAERKTKSLRSDGKIGGGMKNKKF
ncbi:hypothetical protein JCM1841_003955 [Sporobolomyces salmonicolor]